MSVSVNLKQLFEFTHLDYWPAAKILEMRMKLLIKLL